MKYLLIAPQLGFDRSGNIKPSGLMLFGRCVARALASSPDITELGVWSLVEEPQTEPFIRQMLNQYAHSKLALNIKGFGGSKAKLAMAIASASWQNHYDQVMYLLVNQAVLALMPGHPPYTVWQVGREMFAPLPKLKYLAMRHACQLLSISHNTTEVARQNNPFLPLAKVVHLCIEPPLSAKVLANLIESDYQPTDREQAVLIVSNIYRDYLYKGHIELIAAWGEVVKACPQAELWIVGDGDGRAVLEAQAQAMPANVAKQIHFLGRLDDDALQERYRHCRVFAMPSTSEGFGLVFVEAARYGLPSIGGKHDSVKEVVLDNQTGLLVEQNPHDVAQACIRLLTDNDLAKRLGQAARQRYLNYFQFQHFRERLLTMIE